MSIRFSSSLRPLQHRHYEDDDLSSHRSVLGEHDLDDRVTIGMAPLIYTAAHRNGGAASGSIPTHINKVANSKSLLLDSTSRTSSTASLGSLMLEDWYDQAHDDKPAAHIEFPTPYLEQKEQQSRATSQNVWMGQVAALIGVLAVCCFFYLQHYLFLEKED
mmetsp:Transcript_2434/g.4861  ORF Transcript_2434/g.4861 Transcript_2434/m.4861 type:complete len:161 (+) Transcript_2434:96-578(+)